MIADGELTMIELYARNILASSPENVDANDKLMLAAEVRRLRSLTASALQALNYATHLRQGSFDQGWTSPTTGHQMNFILDTLERLKRANPSTPAPSAPVTCFICGGDTGRICACHDGQGQPCDMVCNEPTKPAQAASTPIEP